MTNINDLKKKRAEVQAVIKTLKAELDSVKEKEAAIGRKILFNKKEEEALQERIDAAEAAESKPEGRRIDR